MHDANAYALNHDSAGLRLDLYGELTPRQARALLAELEPQLRQLPAAVDLNIELKHLNPRHSTALAVVLQLSDTCRQHRRNCHWHNASAAVDKLLHQAVSSSQAGSKPATVRLPEQVGRAAFELLADIKIILGFVGHIVHALGLAICCPKHVRWRDFASHINHHGADALPIVSLISFLMGLILGFQAAVQLRVFGADIFVADLVGLSITKELGPLMVAMISTGRAGSAFAAELGTMRVNEEVDALVTMGLEPVRFLVVPKVLALMIVMPLLTVFGNACGIAGGAVVGVFHLNIPMVGYWRQTVSAITPGNLLEGLIKSLVFAFLIAAVGCLRGLRTDGGAEQVGRSTTSAVVSGIFLIVVFDALLTYIFTTIGLGV